MPKKNPQKELRVLCIPLKKHFSIRPIWRPRPAQHIHIQQSMNAKNLLWKTFFLLASLTCLFASLPACQLSCAKSAFPNIILLLFIGIIFGLRACIANRMRTFMCKSYKKINETEEENIHTHHTHDTVSYMYFIRCMSHVMAGWLAYTLVSRFLSCVFPPSPSTHRLWCFI